MEKKLENTATLTNLARAFAGECQANVHLKMVSKKALDQKMYELSKIVYAIAKHDNIHATILYATIAKGLGKSHNNIEITAGFPFKSGTLLENLKNTSDNQASEGKIVYPNFQAVAKDEGFPQIAALFGMLAEVELRHSEIVKTLYEKLKANKLYAASEKQNWTCGICGYVTPAKTASDTCPLCESNVHNVLLTSLSKED